MTRTGFDYALENLNEDISTMGNLVLEQMHQSIEALLNKDEVLASKVIAEDDKVNELQREIENRCLILLGKEQPLAIDLRTLFTVSKIVTDMERIGDHAVGIAKTVDRLKDVMYVRELRDIAKLSIMAESMFKKALDAVVSRDAQAAYSVCSLDDDVDAYFKAIVFDLLSINAQDSNMLNQVAQLLFVCKSLERIGDYTTNICEGTILMVTGDYMKCQ
jgi:phosphate transport system protein